jgi:rhomboid protease GluP
MNFLKDIFANLSNPQGVIIIICIILYALPYILNINPMYFNSLGWKDNAKIIDGEWYRLISSVFLHGGLFHIFLNMYSLYAVAPVVTNLYEYFGKNPNLSFITIFFVSGICGSLASFYFNPNFSLGASGAIFGLIGALLSVAIMRGQTSLLAGLIPTIAINVLYGMSTPMIDNSAHFGGMLGGMGIGALLLLL